MKTADTHLLKTSFPPLAGAADCPGVLRSLRKVTFHQSFADMFQARISIHMHATGDYIMEIA